MTEHGTTDSYDQGCRCPRCVSAQIRRRKSAAVEDIHAQIAAIHSLPPDLPGDGLDDPEKPVP